MNVAKLRGMIVERGTTQEAVAKIIGVDRSTFYRKMNDGGKFTIGEARKIAQALQIGKSEAAEIFLGYKL